MSEVTESDEYICRICGERVIDRIDHLDKHIGEKRPISEVFLIVDEETEEIYQIYCPNCGEIMRTDKCKRCGGYFPGKKDLGILFPEGE